MSVEVRLSYSQLTKYRQCGQAWFYRYVLNLDVPTSLPTPERDFGNWWHALRAADSLERGRADKSLKAKPAFLKTVDDGPKLSTKGITPDRVMKAATKWWKGLDPSYREAFVAALGESLPERLDHLNRKWHERWDEALEDEEVLAVEVRWERALPGITEGYEATLVGVIDEVVYLKRRKMVVVRDHKSHKALGSSTALDDMMDSQLQFYAWGIAPLVKEWGLGQPRATAYDRVRSVAPKTPALTLAGALAKSVTDYDLETYVAWAAGEDGGGVPFGEVGVTYVSGPKKGQPKWGTYTAEDKIIEALSTPAEASKWLQRTLTPLNSTLVQSHLTAAVNTANDIILATERAEARGEAARNLTKNCSWCTYADLCRAQMFGGPQGEYVYAEFGLAVIS